MSKIYPILCVALIAFGCREGNKTMQDKAVSAVQEPMGEDNLAYKWGEMAILATANDTDRFKPRPTITSRYLGLIFVAIFDAWSRYDDRAVPVYLKDVG